MIYLGEKVHDENDDTAFIITILPNDQPLTSPPTSPNLSSSSEVLQDTSKVLFMTREVWSNIAQSIISKNGKLDPIVILMLD